MLKITKNFLSQFKPDPKKKYKKDRDNLSIGVNPSGKVTLSFYFHAGAKQHRILLGSYVGSPSKDDIAYFQEEYTRLYSGLTTANSRSIRALDPGDNVVSGAEAFLAQEFDRQREPHSPDGDADFGPLPEDYLERERVQRAAKTFRTACLAYLEQYEREHESMGSEASLLRHLVKGYGKAKGLGHLEPRAIRAQHIQAILDELKRDHSHTPNHVKKLTSRLWRWMKRRGWVESREEVLDLDAKAPPPRDRVFSEKEIKMLLKGCHQYYKAIALNPLRLIEHTRIHWDEIDEDLNATVKVKGGKLHIQPLTDAYLACGRTTRSEGGWLLPGRHGYTQLLRTSLSDIGSNWAKQHGIPDHHNHDWRTTFGTWHEKQGTPFDVWDACLSHEKKGIRSVYGQYKYLPERREALQTWAEYLESFK